MGAFDGGVTFYTYGRLECDVAFPQDDVKCKWCRFLRLEMGLRHRCSLTERILYSPEHRPESCPLKMEVKIDG